MIINFEIFINYNIVFMNLYFIRNPFLFSLIKLTPYLLSIIQEFVYMDPEYEEE